MALKMQITKFNLKPKSMNDFTNTLGEIRTHLNAISKLISASDFKSDQKQDTLSNLEQLSNQNNNSVKEFVEKLSNFIWNYDKIRIYFVNQKELFKSFYSSYNAIIQLRNELKVGS